MLTIRSAFRAFAYVAAVVALWLVLVLFVAVLQGGTGSIEPPILFLVALALVFGYASARNHNHQEERRQ